MASKRAAAAEVIDLTNSDEEPGSAVRKSLNQHHNAAMNSVAYYSSSSASHHADANPQLRTDVLRNMHMTGAQRGSPSSSHGNPGSAATINAGSERPSTTSPTPRTSSAHQNVSMPHHSHSNSSPVSSTRSNASSFVTAQRSSTDFAALYQGSSSSPSSVGRDHPPRGFPSRQMTASASASASASQAPASDDRARQHDSRASPLPAQSQPHPRPCGHQHEQSSSSSSSGITHDPASTAPSSTSRPAVRSGPVHPSYVKPQMPPIRLSPEDSDSLDAAGGGMGIRHGQPSQYYGRRPASPSNAADHNSGINGVSSGSGAGGNGGLSSQSQRVLLTYASANAKSAAAQYHPHQLHQQLRLQQHVSRIYSSSSAQGGQIASSQPSLYSFSNRRTSQQSQSPQHSPQMTSSPRWSASQPGGTQQRQPSLQRSPPNPGAYPSPTLQSSSWSSSQQYRTPPSQSSQLPSTASSLSSPRQNQQPKPAAMPTSSRSPHMPQTHARPQSESQPHHQHQRISQSHQTPQAHQQQTHHPRQQQAVSQQQQHHHHHHHHHQTQQPQPPVRQTGQPPVPAAQILSSNTPVHRQPPSPPTRGQSPHLLGSRQSSLNASASPRQTLPQAHSHAKNTPHLSSPARKPLSPSQTSTSLGATGQAQPHPSRSPATSSGQARESLWTTNTGNSSLSTEERPGLFHGGTPKQHGQQPTGRWSDSTTQLPVPSSNNHGGINEITLHGSSNNHNLGAHIYTYTRRPPLSAGGESIIQNGTAEKSVPHLTLVPIPTQTPPGSRPGSASAKASTPGSASTSAKAADPVSLPGNGSAEDRVLQNGPPQPLSRTPPTRESSTFVPAVVPAGTRPFASSQTTTAPPQSQPESDTLLSPATLPMTTAAVTTTAEEAAPRLVRKVPVAKPLSKASDWNIPKLESVLQGFLQSLQVDHGIGVEFSIDMAPPRIRKDISSFDDFADMPADHSDNADRSGDSVTVRWKLHRDNQRRPEGRVSYVKAMSLKSPGQRVPRYRFHHVEIAKNILSPNTPLKFIPHIRDLEDGSEDKYKYDQWIEELESMERKSGFDASIRSDKWATTRHQEFIKLLSGYLDRWITNLRIENCNKTTLIRYMANESRSGQATITPQQKNSLLMSCGGDAATPQAMMIASTFTDAFNRVFKSKNVKLHDVLKQDETVENVLEPKKTTKTKDQDKNDSIEQVQQYLGTYTSLKCMICNTHSCEHGEFDSENVRRCFSIDDLGSKLWKHVERRRNRQIREQQVRNKAVFNGTASTNGSGAGNSAIAGSSTTGSWKPCNNQCYQSYDIGDSAFVTREWTEDETNLLRSFHLTFANSSGRVPCTVCNMINRNCWEVYRHMKELNLLVFLRPPTPPAVMDTPSVKPVSWYDRVRRVLNGDWSDHTITHFHALREQREPCNHDGPCTAARDCPCVKAKILCERFCRCTAECCAYKFTGCACHGSGKTCYARQKEGKPCICVQLNRECDPILCGGCGARQRADPEHRDNDELHATGCQNVSLQRGKSKSVVLGQSQLEGCGYGLFTAEDIGADEFIIEYIGELITHDEGVRREARRGDVFNQESNASYLFTLLEQDGIWVDAAIYGNLSRYINHASEHDKRGCNITPKIMYVNGEFRIRFSAMRDIKAGEELFFNYGENFPNLTKKLLEEKASASDDEEMSNAGQGNNTGGARGGNSKARANRNRASGGNSKHGGQGNNRRKVQATRAPTKSVQSTVPNSRAGANSSNIRRRVREKGARKEAPPATAPEDAGVSSAEDDNDDDGGGGGVDGREEAEYVASQMDVDDPPLAPAARHNTTPGKTAAAATKRTGTKRKRRTVYDDDDGDDENEGTGQDDEDVHMGGVHSHDGNNDDDDNIDPVAPGSRRRRQRYQSSLSKYRAHNQTTSDNDHDDGDEGAFSPSRTSQGLRNTRRRSGPGHTTIGPTPAEIAAATGGVVNIFADGLDLPRRRRRKRSAADAADENANNADGAMEDDEPSITAVRSNDDVDNNSNDGSRPSFGREAFSIDLSTASRVRRASNMKRKDNAATSSNSYTDNDDAEQQPRRKRLRTRLADSSHLAAADSDGSSFAGGSVGPTSRPTSQPLSRLRRARQQRVPDSADDETSEFDINNDDDDNASSAPASAVVALGTTDDDQGSVMSAGQFYGGRQGTQPGTAAGTPTSSSLTSAVFNVNTSTGRRRRVISDSEDEADESMPTGNGAASVVAASSFAASQSWPSSAAAGGPAASRPLTPLRDPHSASTSLRGGGDDDGGSEVSSSVDRSQRKRQKPARYRGEAHK